MTTAIKQTGTTNGGGSRVRPPLTPSPLRPLLSPRHPRISASPRRAFTLVEMLVVMAVIVLAVTMAIPAIRFLTGSKSQQGATNTLSAYVGFARNDAIGLQQTRGVVFVLDDDDRIKVYEVEGTSDLLGGDVPGVVYLDFVPDRDPLSLPAGVRLWTLNDADPVAAKYPTYTYLGMNRISDFVTGGTPSRTDRRIGGVILFGADGRLQAVRYGFRFINHASNGTAFATPLGQFFAVDQTGMFTPGIWPTDALVLNSSIGFVLCDKEEMYSNLAQGAEGNNDSVVAKQVNNYFDLNTTPLFVNRYSGTLTQAE